ncbi:hypothetical protein [Streptomyces sp. NBC_01264]|uniref:hypothetical protein n=1 Tax=Streptomyces sp. NBC_01264 TaxID=2903804 RepID=UPI0022550C33|nr:hypothetical protein [Streptomyces sp. NBC_01264]MCX4784293.1 hypothetical protein [Streptomyces sp. NBC_01264]
MHQSNPDAPVTPLTKETVASAFNYLRAVEAGDLQTATKLVAAEPRMSALLAGVAEGIVFAGTSLPGPDDDAPTWDSFALETLGKVFLHALHLWQQSGPDAAHGIAQTVNAFFTTILFEPNKLDERDSIADALNTYESAARGQLLLDAKAASAAAHPVGNTAV